eukprot:5910204-Prymnesium_polylepis.1
MTRSTSLGSWSGPILSTHESYFYLTTPDSESHTCGPANILARSARGAQRHRAGNMRRGTRD